MNMLGLLLACVTLQSPELSGASRWLRLRSSNFDLLTSAGEKKGRNLVLHFERVRSFFVASMGSVEVPSFPVRIIGFNSDREFEPFQPNEAAAAFFAGGLNGDYIVMKDASPDYYPMAIHEYVHLLTRYSGLRAPPWWQEGLAELYSTLRAAGDKVEVGTVLRGRFNRLKKEPLLDLAVLLRAGHDSPLYNDKDKAELFYAESWALVHMLLVSEEYGPRSDDFLKMLATEADPADVFNKVYGKTLPQVQKDLASYLHRGAFNSVLFSVKLGKSKEPLVVAPATDLEVQVALANVSLAMGKSIQARQILERLSRVYPDSREVDESLGYVYWLAASHEEARRHFRRAVEKGTTNAKTYLDYAGLLGETGVANSTLIPLLEKALELQPTNRQANLKLASLYLSDRRYEMAVARLRKLRAAGIAETFQASCLLAYAYLGLGEIGAAKKSVEDARTCARTPSEVSEVERLSRSVTDQQQIAAQPKPEPAYRPSKTAETPPLQGSPKSVPASEEAQPQADRAAPDLQIRGQLRRIDCLDRKLRLILDAGHKQVAFLIVDPTRVIIKGSKQATVVFYCGPQPDLPVVVTYIPKPNAQFGTAGQIVSIEFLKPDTALKTCAAIVLEDQKRNAGGVIIRPVLCNEEAPGVRPHAPYEVPGPVDSTTSADRTAPGAVLSPQPAVQRRIPWPQRRTPRD